MDYTSRISLRSFKLTDVDDFLKWASDNRVTRYLRWDTITSREEALSYLKNQVYLWHKSICLDDVSIGYLSIKQAHDDNCRAHISYALATEFWGRGIVTIALKRELKGVFDEFKELVRIEAFVEVENVGSQRVLEKVGFMKEGLLRKYGVCTGEIRDVFIYSLLSTDKVLG